MKALYLVLTVVFLLGCGVSGERLTATAVLAKAQTQTAEPTLIPTSTSTLIPQPTATSTPRPTKTPEPTPSSVGETVRYNTLEITLLEVVTHSHIVTGGYYNYYSKPGEIFIDVAVLVRNTGNSAVRVLMKDIYIVDETGDGWYSNFSGLASVDVGKHFNPLATLKLDETYSGDTSMSFQKDTYLRLVFYVKNDQKLLFGIQDSPQFAFQVK